MPESREAEVYAGIYDIVAGNRKAAGETFGYGKSTFLCDVMSHPQDIIVSKYLDLPNEEFMEAMYVAALKRLPDAGSRFAAVCEKACPVAGCSADQLDLVAVGVEHAALIIPVAGHPGTAFDGKAGRGKPGGERVDRFPAAK